PANEESRDSSRGVSLPGGVSFAGRAEADLRRRARLATCGEPHPQQVVVVDRRLELDRIAGLDRGPVLELRAHRSASGCKTRQLVLDRVPVRGVVDVTEQIEIAGTNGPRTHVRAVGRVWKGETAADLPAVGCVAVVLEEPLPQPRGSPRPVDV